MKYVRSTSQLIIASAAVVEVSRALAAIALISVLMNSVVRAEVVASADASQFAPELPKPLAPSPDAESSQENPEGESLEQDETEVTKQYLREGFGQFVESRDDLSKRLFRLGLGIDRYLAGREGLEEPNETYARIRLAQTWLEGDGLVNDSDIKFRLDLPSTKRKYRLIFENSTEDEGTLRDRSNPTGLSNANLDREGMSAAVRLAISDLENWKSDFDLGIRGSMPLDPFARHNLKRHWELGSDWHMRMRQQVGYFHSKGYVYDLKWGFDRLLETDLAARYITELEWEQKEDKLQFGQGFGVTKFLTDRRLLDYSVGIAGQSLSSGMVEIYYAALTHRTLLYEDWLILDLVPEVRFPRERDFEDTLAFTVRLEVLFFEHNPFRP